MKIIKEEANIFVCDGCGKESRVNTVIEECEKQHKCDHKRFELVVNKKYLEYESFVDKIEKRCIDCEHCISSVFFDDLLVEEDEKIEKLFNLMDS